MKRESEWPVVEICISPCPYRVLQRVVPKVRDIFAEALRDAKFSYATKVPDCLSSRRRLINRYPLIAPPSSANFSEICRSKVNLTVELVGFPSFVSATKTSWAFSRREKRSSDAPRLFYDPRKKTFHDDHDDGGGVGDDGNEQQVSPPSLSVPLHDARASNSANPVPGSSKRKILLSPAS